MTNTYSGRDLYLLEHMHTKDFHLFFRFCRDLCSLEHMHSKEFHLCLRIGPTCGKRALSLSPLLIRRSNPHPHSSTTKQQLGFCPSHYLYFLLTSTLIARVYGSFLSHVPVINRQTAVVSPQHHPLTFMFQAQIRQARRDNATLG